MSRGMCLISAAARWPIQTKLNKEAPSRTLAGGARTSHAALVPHDSWQRHECTEKNKLHLLLRLLRFKNYGFKLNESK